MTNVPQDFNAQYLLIAKKPAEGENGGSTKYSVLRMAFLPFEMCGVRIDSQAPVLTADSAKGLGKLIADYYFATKDPKTGALKIEELLLEHGFTHYDPRPIVVLIERNLMTFAVPQPNTGQATLDAVLAEQLGSYVSLTETEKELLKTGQVRQEAQHLGLERSSYARYRGVMDWTM